MLEQLIKELASSITTFVFDVDGVMTTQGPVTIYDVSKDIQAPHLVLEDGIRSMRWVPCDENGVPLSNIVEYLAGNEGEPIMEGYRFDTRDGKVVEYLVQYGFPVYFMSGRNSPAVRKRALALGAIPVLGVTDKLAEIKKLNLNLQEICYIGDGIQDCEAMGVCRLSIAPNDACEEVKKIAHAHTLVEGGKGVLHEVVSLFLKERGLWPA